MRKICIFSIKGGVGKTTTAINMAAGLSRHDKKILLIDLDPQGSIDLSLRVKPDYTIYESLADSQAIHNCIVNLGKNLDVIASKSSLRLAEEYLSQNANGKVLLREMLKKLAGYDFIIIDLAPSFGLITQNALAFADELFIPVSTDFLGFESIPKMQEIVDSLNKKYGHKLKITKIIPTLFDRRNKICKETLADIQNQYYELASYPIHYNSKVKEAPKYGKSIFSHAKSSTGAQDYGRLADDVLAMKPAKN